MKSPFVRLGQIILTLTLVLGGGGVTSLLYAQGEPAVVRRPITGPTVISRPGVYVLQRGIMLGDAGTAIVITASNVSLDLNGLPLSGPGGKQGVGIRVDGASDVSVHGGSLSRFATGVEVSNSANVHLEGLQIDGEDAGGPPPGEVGILILNSRGVVVERNEISHTFLGIFVRGAGSGGNRIANNTLVGGSNGQLGICYNPDASGRPTGPSGDLVYNNLVSRFKLGLQTSAGTAGNIFRENAIAYVVEAINEIGPNQNVFADNHTIAVVP
jgi:parallel beta-helix repeat protein